MAIGSTGKRVLIYGSFLISVILFLRQATITYNDTLTYGGTDLRARIVGTRLMNNELNPYFTKWKTVLGERLCDPNDRYDRPVNGVTSTPFVLWLQTPLAAFDYGTIRVVWWGLQQLLLLVIAALCLYLYRLSVASVAAMLICFGLLTNHPAWLFHAERGQVYILYATWIAGLFSIWSFNRNNTFNIIILSTWLALGVLLRPTLIVFALPSFLYTLSGKRWLLIGGCCLSVIVLLLVSDTWLHWQGYLSAMQVYNHPEQLYNMADTVQPPQFPAIIEGTTNITYHKQHPNIVFLASLEYYFRKLGYNPGMTVYMLICIFVNAILLLLVWKNTRFKLKREQLLMLGILLYTTTDICQRLRTAYNLMMWLPACLIMAGYIFKNQIPKNILVHTTKGSDN